MLNIQHLIDDAKCFEAIRVLRWPNGIQFNIFNMKKTPGVDMTVGSLGQGLSAGLGMALSGKLRRKDYHVWVVIGDGETQEGAIWQARQALAEIAQHVEEARAW